MPAITHAPALLRIQELHLHYGAIHALKGISLAIYPGEIVALIGSNGAGKTSLLRCISGLLKASAGRMEYRDEEKLLDLNRQKPHHIVGAGIAQVPEGRMIFQNLSVEENLALGAWGQKDKARILSDKERVFTLFPRLGERLRQNAGTLSGGEQQMLAIGRALMSRPRLLLLDEPSLGIAPALTQQIFKTLLEIRQAGTTIFLVEQDAYLALKTAERAYVLETGCIVKTDLAANLLQDPSVGAAYLGGS